MRTKTNSRDLMETAICKTASKADFAGDDAGGFIFSEFQPSFDAMYAFAKMMEMLTVTDLRVSELASELPPRLCFAGDGALSVGDEGPRDAGADQRGRRGGEWANGQRVELVDGIKFFDGTRIGRWFCRTLPSRSSTSTPKATRRNPPTACCAGTSRRLKR